MVYRIFSNISLQNVLRVKMRISFEIKKNIAQDTIWYKLTYILLSVLQKLPVHSCFSKSEEFLRIRAQDGAQILRWWIKEADDVCTVIPVDDSHHEGDSKTSCCTSRRLSRLRGHAISATTKTSIKLPSLGHWFLQILHDIRQRYGYDNIGSWTADQ